MKTLKQFASAGGKARAKKLSAKRRKEIASMGGKAKKSVTLTDDTHPSPAIKGEISN